MEERNSNYKIEQSRTGLPVPVLNGVYLHSIYNPEKEAQALVEKYQESLNSKNHVLIFGLGFGYHVDEVLKQLKMNHDHFEVVVVEPNTKLIEDFLATRPIDDERVQIINVEKPEEMYGQAIFIEFLMKKPCVVKHEASFSINKDFYLSLLSFKANTKIANFSNLLTDSAKKLIDSNTNESVKDYTNSIIASGRIKNQQEFLTLAFDSIINK